MAQNKKKKNQSTETDQGMTQIINLEEKNIKTVLLYSMCSSSWKSKHSNKDMENIFFKNRRRIFQDGKYVRQNI